MAGLLRNGLIFPHKQFANGMRFLIWRTSAYVTRPTPRMALLHRQHSLFFGFGGLGTTAAAETANWCTHTPQAPQSNDQPPPERKKLQVGM